MKQTMKRMVSFILAVVMVFSLLPQITPQARAADFAAGSGYDPVDKNGYPTSCNGPVVLALCYMGDTFPGEPSNHATGNYLRYNLNFEYEKNTKDYFSAGEVLQNVIGADGYVMGEYSKGLLSTSSTSGIFDANGLDEEHFTQKFNDALAEHEQEMIADVIAAKQDKNQQVGSTNPADYEIVWYIIKYQYSTSILGSTREWHVNGLIREKDKYSVVYDANGATVGAPPDGVIDMSYASAQNYEIQGNTRGLSRGNQYNFIGWNTRADGSGVFFSAEEVADLTVLGENPITLYAQWAEKNKVKVNWYDGEGLLIHVDTDLVSGDKVSVYDGAIPTRLPENDKIYTFNNIWHDSNGNVVSLPITMGNKDINLYAQFDSAPRTYTVTWVNRTVIETDSGISYGNSVSYGGNVPTRNTTETEGYLFIGWSTQENGSVEYGLRDTIEVKSDMALHAQFQRVPLRTVTWYTQDGSTVLATQRVLEGDKTTYPNAAPTKPGHSFAGWATSKNADAKYASGEEILVNGDMSLYAAFETEKFTVTWVNWDDTVLETDQNVPYGTVPNYNGAVPTRTSDVDKVYQFIGWTPDVDAVTGDITYKATYSSATREYTVTWNNYDNTLLKAEKVKYGTVPSYTGADPERPDTDEHTFSFIGWKPTVSAVTGDVTYTADFKEEDKEFTATVNVWVDPVVNTETGAISGGERKDLSAINAPYTKLYLRDVENSAKIYPLTRTAEGTYTASVIHGTYVVIAQFSVLAEPILQERLSLPAKAVSGDPDSTSADLIFYSVTYDMDGGKADGKTEIVEYYQRGSDVLVSDYVPERSLYTFTNTWQLDDNTADLYRKDQRITVLGSGIIRPHTLKAGWVRTNDKVIVNLTIHHHSDPALSGSIGMNPHPGNTPIRLDLTYRPAGSSEDYVQQGSSHSLAAGWVTNANTVSRSAQASGKGYATKTTSLSFSSTVTGFAQLRHDAEYSSNIILDDYFLVERTVRETVDPVTGDVTYIVDATLQYHPALFQFRCTVEIDESVPDELVPDAVDLKLLSYKNGAWSPISRHEHSSVEARFPDRNPITGTYGVPVKDHEDNDFFYHVAVVGFTLPDGTELTASAGSVKLVDYKSDATGSTAVYQYAVGAYTAVVSVVSDRAAADGTKAIYGVGNAQAPGTSVTVTVFANPSTVTLDPNGGKLDGSEDDKELKNQFRIPVLGTYTPTREGGYIFDGWRLPNGDLAVVGEPITENVTLTARWKEPLRVSGEVRIDAEDSEGRDLHFVTLPTSLKLTLEKTTPSGDVLIAQEKTYTLTESDYDSGMGVVSYAFDPVAQDGSSYRVYVSVINYNTAFLNEPGSIGVSAATLNQPESYTGTRDAVDSNADGNAKVYAYLVFNPQDFDLTWEVDASAIGAAFRPDSLDLLVLFNCEHHFSVPLEEWKIIVQHYHDGVYDPENTALGADGRATDSFPVWNVDPSGHAYDYALKLHRWIKNGDAHAPSAADPFTVTMNPAIARYNGIQQVTGYAEDNLRVTLVPKTYTITYQLAAGSDPVLGLNGEPTEHTWSYKTIEIPLELTRDGYDFLGWQANVSGYSEETVDGVKMGTISAETAQNITLTAQWRKQKQVTFQVENGTWDDGTTDSITVSVSLDENGNGTVSLPAGMIASYGYTGGSWSSGLSGDSAAVSGDGDATYTFTFQRLYHPVGYDTDGKDGTDSQDSVAHGNFIRVDPMGGTWNGSAAVQDILIEAAEDLAAPTRKNYVFAGWIRSFVEETIAGGVVTHRYTARWFADENGDGIADLLQKKIIFQIENGTWNGTSSAPIVVFVTLNANGTADITEHIPTGMQPRIGFLSEGAFWSPNLPTDNIVNGRSEETFTYRHYTTVTYRDYLSGESELVTILPGNFISVEPAGGIWDETTAGTIVQINGSHVLEDPVYTNHNFLGWAVSAGETPVDYIFTAQWEKESYTIVWKNDDGTTLETDNEVEFGTMPEYNGATPKKASTAEFDYVFKGWTPEVVVADQPAVYTAEYTAIRRSYTVTWQDWDNEILDTDLAEYGSIPAYAGIPTRPNTAEFTYAFIGWWNDVNNDGVQDASEFFAKGTTLPMVKGAVTYKAVYSDTTNKYMVTWLDEDGTELKSELVAYGELPTAPADPTKAATAQYTYTFSGWTPTVSSVTGDVTYRAGYTATVNKYTVTWYEEDGTTVIDTEEVEYGTRPTVPAEPDKADTAQYTYTFSGWKSGEFVYIPESIPAVTADVSYTAQFSQTTNKYMVTWQNYDGTILEQDSAVEYGSTPSFSATNKLTKEDANSDYEFLGWYLSTDAEKTVVDLAGQTVTGDVTYVAKYNVTAKARQVTIHVWVNAADAAGKDGTAATIGTVTNGKRANLYLAPMDTLTDASTFIQIPWNETAQAYTAMFMPGDYRIYAGNTAAEAVPEANQIVSVDKYNVSIHTLYNSVRYDALSGSFANGPVYTEYYKSGAGPVYILETLPTYAGHVFTHWHDASENNYNASTSSVPVKLTESITRGYTLTAHWSEAKDITVVVKIDTLAGNGHTDPSVEEKTLNLQLAGKASGATSPYVAIFGSDRTAKYSASDSAWSVSGNTYTYTYTYTNQHGDFVYDATALLPGYARSGSEVSADGKTVTIHLKYDPDGFDLNFMVMADGNVPDALVPRAVDVQIVFFERTDKNGNGQWEIIPNSEAKAIEVVLKKQDGVWMGTGTYHVWSEYTTPGLEGELYLYRIAITDFDLGANRGILSAKAGTGENAFKIYSSVAGNYHPANAYTAEVTVVDLNCENGLAGGLLGAHDSGGNQHGTITATISVHPYTVVQHYEDETTSDKLTKAFVTPALDKPTRAGYTFDGWWTKNSAGEWDREITAAGTAIMNLVSSGTTLDLYARWKEDLTVSGDVTVSNLFEGDPIHDQDRPDTIKVDLLNAATNAVLRSETVTLTDDASDAFRTGTYEFKNVPDNGTQYRVIVQAMNFELKYRNEQASAFAEDAYTAVDENGDGNMQVDISLSFEPHTFPLEFTVDASAIGEDFRPTNAGIVVKAATNSLDWIIIAQQMQDGAVEPHVVAIDPETGKPVADAHGGTTSIWHHFDVWRRGSHGDLYGYAVEIWNMTFFGKTYSNDQLALAPFTMVYDPAYAWYDAETGEQTAPPALLNDEITLTHPDPSNPHGLVAYLIPKTYTVTFELGRTGKVPGATTVDGNTARTNFLWSYGLATLPDALPTSATGVSFAGWWTKDAEGNWDKQLTEIKASTEANVTLYARWNYTITWDSANGSAPVSEIVLEGTMPTAPADPVKAADSQFTYTFTGWSPAVSVVTGNRTYTAQYADTTNSYRITWVNWDGTELGSSFMEYGAMPAYTGQTPTKASTAQYRYTFSGWTPAVDTVTGEATYTATFTETLRSYTVLWKNHDGTTLDTDSNVNYGVQPVYDSLTPVKTGDAQYSYTFIGWKRAGDETVYATADVPTTTGDVTYTAQFEASVNTYTVTWKNWNGDVLDTDTLPYGSTPSYEGTEPSRDATVQVQYVYTGWDKPVAEVTGDVTYTAKFAIVTRNYAVTWVNWDGEVLETDPTVPYGELPQYNGATPTKAADKQYTYTFDKWDPVVSTVTGNVTYTATFTSVVNEYIITWKNAGGAVLRSEKLAYGATPNYGATPTMPADVQYTYTFSHWSPAIETVTGNAIYTAVYDKQLNEYEVKWVDWDGTVLKTETLAYGATPTAPATPVRDDDGKFTYTFTGWDVEIKEVTGNATYQAMYDGTLIGYTITWVDDEGQELYNQNYYFGDKPSYPGEDPVKESTDQYSYTFDGWIPEGGGEALGSDELPTVTGNATYKAKFTAKVQEYTVTWKNGDTVLKTETLPYGTTPAYSGETPTKAADAQYTYTFSDWTPAIEAVKGDATYTAQFTNTVNTYTVRWLNYDGSEIRVDTLAYGTLPDAPTATRPSDGDYNYTFTGWDVEVKEVTDNVTYQALYKATRIGYTITWVDENDQEIRQEPHYLNDQPIFSGGDPVKASTAQYSYTFLGWKKVGGDDTLYSSLNLPKVTGDATYKAEFQENLQSYTITWKNGETVLKTEVLPYGTTPAYSGETPTKEADAQYTYTFSGWSPAIEEVTGDITYTAQFTSTVRSYTVRWLNYDGTEIEKQTLPYGATPTAPADPSRPADVEFSYSFIGWNAEIKTVTGDATYQALYKGTKIGYTIIWQNWDGSEIHRETHYYGDKPVYTGEEPVKAMDEQNIYSFIGWKAVGKGDTIHASNDLLTVEENLTYVAQFKSTPRLYTVIWKNGETVLDTQQYVYNELPLYTGETPTKEADAQYTYTFSGWTPSVVKVTADAVYQATFNSTVNTYTVKWIDWDGTVLKTETLAYGETPTAPSDPTRADQDGYAFDFSGWDNSPAEVRGDATYQALYTSEAIKYNITWIYENGTQIHQEIHYYGDHVSYTGAVPTKESDVQFTYSFSGWKLQGGGNTVYPSDGLLVVKQDATYVAQFQGTLRSYTVTWKNDDGTVLKTDTLPYGTTPVYGATPTKDADAQYTYTFSGWTPDVKAVDGDAVYTATYTETVNSYKVTWLDWDGRLIHEELVSYNTTPTEPAKPERAATAEYTYTCTGWNHDVVPVTGNVTYQAVYTAEAVGYTIIWIDEDGTELHRETRYYGAKPIYSGAEPTKAADNEFTYAFDGWNLVGGDDTLHQSLNLPVVTADATYRAHYDKAPRSYTVTWKNGETVLKTETLLYGATPDYTGETPTKAETAQYTYTFSGWTPDVKDVEGDAVYTATFNSTVRTYTIRWLDWDGEELKSETLDYGAKPTAPANPSRDATSEYTYTFDKWDVPIADVTGDAVYQALYTSERIAYVIRFVDENGQELHREMHYIGDNPTYSGAVPTKASTAQYDYTFYRWSLDGSLYESDALKSVDGNATYTATFTETLRSYTVTWKNGETVLKTETLSYGATPAYSGETPTKEANVQYTYAFSGWSPAIEEVTGDATYTAQFSSTVRSYTVKWINYDGAVIKTETLTYGAMPTAPADPTRPATAENTYTFTGWDKAAVAVTGDATYQAQYEGKPISYTITWEDENGVQLREEKHYYGGKPTYSGGDPVKASTAEHDFTFVGWIPEGGGEPLSSNNLPQVTGNATYTAKFTATVREYTVTWLNAGGTTLKIDQVKFGATPKYLGTTPTKDQTDEFTFEFKGWSPNITPVNGDATYTATFTPVRRSYTVTWQNEDGTILDKDTVLYGDEPNYTGETPTKASTLRYHYTHSGWTAPLKPVTGDVTYVAAFTMHINEFTVTWRDEDGTVLRTDTVAYDEIPDYGTPPVKDDTAQYTYTFSGWTPDVVAVTGNAEYKATYTQTVNEYLITWLDEDGTVLKQEEVAYGSTPTAPADPVKQPDAQFTYTFSGWDKPVEEVAGEATYKAVYSKTVNTYTVTWVNWDDSVLETDLNVPYGTTPTYDSADPTKPETVENVFTWNAWEQAVVPVTGNVTYKAKFTQSANTYTVVWKNYDGTVLETDDDVPYGEMPTYDGADPVRDATAQYTYTFDAWTPAVQSVSGDAEYVAVFSQTVNSYTVTYTDGVKDSEVFADQSHTAEYGAQTPAFTGTVNRAGYIFKGWSPAVQHTVTGDITYTAQWDKDLPVIPVVPPVVTTGTAKLVKVDAEDQNTRLQGVVFKLYRADGTLLGEAKTDADGQIVVQTLTPGEYYWIETRPAEGYVLDHTKHTFTIRSGSTATVTVTNHRSEVPVVFAGEHHAFIAGYNDGTVRPEANITRAEVAAIFFRLLDPVIRKQYLTYENSFSDVPADKWFHTEVSTMAAMGIISGYPNGEFRPDANITRAEFAAIAARFDADGNTTGASFKDIYDHWAKKEINIAANNGWVLGYEDDTFRPDQFITRAEAMAMVNRVLQRIPESQTDLIGTMVKWIDNQDKTKWYYLTVQEATNSHDYGRKRSGYEYWLALRELPDWSAMER